MRDPALMVQYVGEFLRV